MDEPGGWLRRFALDRPEARAWALYDWANSGFWAVVITAVFPQYYAEVASELSSEAAEFRFTLATTVALLLIAILAPFLGTIADFRASKKAFFSAFVTLGIVATACMFFVHPGGWLLALMLFGAANIGASGSVIFYDAFLPHVARKCEMDRLSSSGFALGYLGGGLLLALNLAWILKPAWFGLPSGEGLSSAEATLPVRLALLSVAVWWSVFTIPMWLRVKEPPRVIEEDESPDQSLMRVSIQRVSETFRELRRYRQAFLLLLAFLIYNDGILTIIRMSSLYAASIGLNREVVVGTFLGVQFVGIPCALVFGQLAGRFGPKRMIMVGVLVYCAIPVLAYFMVSELHFVLLGLCVAAVQGGTQALSRSLFASMIPRHKSGEFFAFFAVGEKFAGVMGQAGLTVLVGLTGSLQISILCVIVFFVVGAALLRRVDVEEGRREAQAAEAGLVPAA